MLFHDPPPAQAAAQPGQMSAPTMTGQQALYLLALMAQLAQAAQQGQAQQQSQPSPEQPQVQPQAQPVSGAPPVPVVAGVELPALPVGTRGNRHYWFGPLPSSSRSRAIRGPIRSAWSR